MSKKQEEPEVVYGRRMEFGPNEDNIFDELAVEGCCKICSTMGRIHQYLRECWPCFKYSARRKHFGWRD